VCLGKEGTNPRIKLAKGFALDIPSGYGSQEPEVEEVRMAAASALSIHERFCYENKILVVLRIRSNLLQHKSLVQPSGGSVWLLTELGLVC
jgi:hypothetical protein